MQVDVLSEFRRGYLEDGLAIEEFANFGPVCLFQSSFLKSQNRVSSLFPNARRLSEIEVLVDSGKDIYPSTKESKFAIILSKNFTATYATVRPKSLQTTF
jgi:hypothetical protein